jgi:hypothetical protein
VQRNVLAEIIQEDPLLMAILKGISQLELSGGLLCSGAIYNTAWNVLTGRPRHLGIKDADIVYFDPSDLSYEAEDAVIRLVQAHFSDLPIPVEVRNQARVHLWFPDKFGIAYAQLQSSDDLMLYFATKAHAVAARFEREEVAILAPFGLDDLFSFRLTPNTALANRETHENKARRSMAIWPELTFVPWPD